MRLPRSVTTTTLLVSDAVVLVALRPALVATVREGASARDWIARDGADRVAVCLAAAGLWCVAAWVGVGLLAVLASHLPGVAGTSADVIARVALPAVLRRIVVGSAGLGVLLSPFSVAVVPASAHAPDGSGGRPVAAAPAPNTGVRGEPLPGPTWPGSGAATPTSPGSASPGGPSSPAAPGPTWRGSSPSPSPTIPKDPPATTPRQPRNAPVPRPAPKPRTSATVRAGDSLWLLAAHRLGPHADDGDVAAYVPTVYRANRSVIGDDPDLLLPGQHLTMPESP